MGVPRPTRHISSLSSRESIVVSPSSRRSYMLPFLRAEWGPPCESDEKGPDARRRPKAACEAYFLYVEHAAEGANEADGPLSSLSLAPDGEGHPHSRPRLRSVARHVVHELHVQVLERAGR